MHDRTRSGQHEDAPHDPYGNSEFLRGSPGAHEPTGTRLRQRLRRDDHHNSRAGVPFLLAFFLDLLNAVRGNLVPVTADAAFDTVAVDEAARARSATVVVNRPGPRTFLATARGRPRGIGRSRW